MEHQNLHSVALMLRQLRALWENVHGEVSGFDNRVRVMTFFFFFVLFLVDSLPHCCSLFAVLNELYFIHDLCIFTLEKYQPTIECS